MSARYELYVKKAGDGGCRGSCPFSQRAFMFYLITNSEDNLSTVSIDLTNKPESFLKLNQAGTCPVLIDHGSGDKIIADSADICKYLDVAEKDLKVNYDGPAVEATSEFFGKFVQLMRNQDASQSAKLKDELFTGLKKLEDYLNSDTGKAVKFLIADHLCEIDCAMLPRLHQVRISGKHFKGLDIDAAFPAIAKYLQNGYSTPIWQKTSPTDDDVNTGWKRHNPMIEKL